MNLLKNKLYEKHSRFLVIITKISFGISAINALINWFNAITTEARNDSLIDFIIAFLVKSAYWIANTILGGIMVWVVAFLITIIPYLVWRGFTK
jgi:hypothetical protein